jgi:hypothetical protein
LSSASLGGGVGGGGTILPCCMASSSAATLPAVRLAATQVVHRTRSIPRPIPRSLSLWLLENSAKGFRSLHSGQMAVPAVDRLPVSRFHCRVAATQVVHRARSIPHPIRRCAKGLRSLHPGQMADVPTAAAAAAAPPAAAAAIAASSGCSAPVEPAAEQ